MFGYLPIELARTLLCKYFHEEDAETILAEMIKTFSEAKQAGFFGRGIKSCTNLPLLQGTDYKVELKPSKNFKPLFRVFGRNPKSASSKLEIFLPKTCSLSAQHASAAQ